MDDGERREGHARRRLEVDALRGVAVLLMLWQHLGFWLWRRPGGREQVAGWFVGLNALGGLAAPLFLVLAGIGCALLVAGGRPRADRTLAARGVVLIGLGYLLNVLAPSWFSWGSWYVLHMLGLAIAVTPLTRRLGTAGLLALFVLVLILTPVAQHLLGTPPRLTNARMRDDSLPGGVLRLALAEGQFPVLPWLALHAAGLVAGGWIVAGRERRVVALGISCLLLAATLGIVRWAGGAAVEGGPFGAAARVRAGFYPASTLLICSLTGAALLAVYGATRTRAAGIPAALRWLVPLGRSSLTILFVHIVLFRELTPHVGLRLNMSTAGTLAVIVGFAVLCALLSSAWGRVGYRYGAEWFLRRVSALAAGSV